MAALPYIPDSDGVQSLVSKVDRLAVLPHVVFQVLEISNSNDSSIADLGRAITVDPGFSSKVLAMANSAYFGLPRQVTSIRDALVFLGMKTVRNLAMTVGVFDMFVGKTDRESMRRRGWWRHSLDTAIAGKWLANLTRKAAPDDAYTCGLIHLIGKTLMDRYGGHDYDLVALRIAEGESALSAEHAIFGYNHIEAAIAAADLWRFPEALCRGIDVREPSNFEDAFTTLRAVTALASNLAGAASDPDAEPAAPWVFAALDISPELENELRDKAASAIANAGMAG